MNNNNINSQQCRTPPRCKEGKKGDLDPFSESSATEALPNLVEKKNDVNVVCLHVLMCVCTHVCVCK